MGKKGIKLIMKKLSTNLMEYRRKLAVWSSIMAMATVALLPVGASAGQLTTRKTVLSSSAASAVTTYTTTFTMGTAGQTLGSLKVELCDSPLQTATCLNSGGSSGVSMSGALLTGVTGSIGTGTWTIGAKTSNSALVNKSLNDVQTGNPTLVVTLNTITNPSAINSSFYLRVSTYTATAGGGTNTDFGAMALSTTQALTVSANVQESLTFCTGNNVAASTGCGDITGSTVAVGTGTDNVLSTSPSGGVSVMYVTTNATTGYSITYLAPTFSSSNDTIPANSAVKAALPGAGTAAFGINLAANTGPSITGSAAVSGAGSGAVDTNYNTANQFAFVPATATPVASATIPTLQNRYVVSYAAQAGSLTKPGAYSAVFTYIATGTF